MTARLILALAWLLTAIPAWAVDLKFKWDAADGATGYKLYQSEDDGATWTDSVDAGAVVEYQWTGRAEDQRLFFKCCAYDASANETCNEYAGAWYDHRQVGSSTSFEVAMGRPLDKTETCRVSTTVLAANGQIPRVINAVALLKSGPNGADARTYDVVRSEGIFNRDTGLLYWDVLRGATVLFYVKQKNIRKTVVVPSQATATLDDL